MGSRLKNQLKIIEYVNNAAVEAKLQSKVYLFGGLSNHNLINYRIHDDSDFIVLGKKNYYKLTKLLCGKYNFCEVNIPFFKGFSVKFFENKKLKNSGTVEIRYMERRNLNWWFVIPFFAYPFTKFKSMGIPNIVFKNLSSVDINKTTIQTLPIEYSYILKSYGKTNKDKSDVAILDPIINKKLVKKIEFQASEHGMALTMNRILFNFCRSRCTYGLSKKEYLSLNT